MGQPGDDLTIEVDAQRANDSAIVSRSILSANGKTDGGFLLVLGFDTETEGVATWAWANQGGPTKGTVFTSGDKQYEIRYRGVVVVWNVVDDDSYTTQFTKVKRRGQSLPDGPVNTWKRQK